MSALKKIGVELAALHQNKQNSSTQSARFGGSPPDEGQPIRVYKRDPGSASTLGGGGTGPGSTKRGNSAQDNPMAVGDLTKDAEYFKEGVEILGLSMNEMELFINPGAAAASRAHTIDNSPARSLVSSSGVKVNVTTANAGLIERLDRIDDGQRGNMGQIDQREIEEIGDYCVRMLNDIAHN